ncbi:recombinase family protein [Muricauda sp. SCSIO 64092]|uniref:recombinase family protein n=1 Tax=Allomuricauda sp. SCSIO 64092 TaxID=2908842 RepID=UPI001FF6D49F|nr:recombinase family protein [Muricauda sp. SCSIO 64092]UOY06742.1 recombinase family protein [Muricauda sp. SCSIO 64092]
MTVGYARVSTPEQKLEAQIDLLKSNGCEKIYSDIASGTKDDRKGLKEMLKYMRKGDTILTYKNDCVFRSLRNMVELIDRFNGAGVHFKSLSEPEFDTTTEKVNWYVFKNPITVSLKQVKELQKLMPMNNYRNEQPLNGRKILSYSTD